MIYTYRPRKVNITFFQIGQILWEILLAFLDELDFDSIENKIDILLGNYSLTVSDNFGVQVLNIHRDILQNRRELPFRISWTIPN